MEIIHAVVGEFTRRSRSLVLRHGETMLERGLEPGEDVIVTDGELHWGATVADLDFEASDTVYRLELVTRLEPDEFGDWALRSSSARGLSRAAVLELLGHLRASQRLLAPGKDPVEDVN